MDYDCFDDIFADCLSRYAKEISVKFEISREQFLENPTDLSDPVCRYAQDKLLEELKENPSKYFGETKTFWNEHGGFSSVISLTIFKG